MARAAERARVLIVDDAVEDCELCKEYLERRGYAVTMAFDGEDAVARALESSFDVVVLDIVLPRLDGLQVLTLLRSYASTRGLPVVTVSAQIGEQARAAALDAGADLALEKPLSPADLELTVRALAARDRKLRSGDRR